ncbi:insulinase family protein [Fundidesulfovibrio butyratiphilus]
MSQQRSFILLRQERIEEYDVDARLYRHEPTGAELLSLSCPDENKVFGVTLRTPAADSTGLPHILEHSVLCGSRKYPVKEPFVELLKSSLQTFLNAFTYPDKTCYPVASANLADFHNLVDVYLDAVFHPRIPEEVFGQEGWHIEPQGEEYIFKGVVYNEMKGAYSSPDSLLAEYTQRELFPDVTYGQDSGGDPAHIPDLTYRDFTAFHQRYYHPSNARFFFYGDDDPESRLAILEEYLKDFGPGDPRSEVAVQARFAAPKAVTRTYDCGPVDPAHPPKASFTLSWLLPEAHDNPETVLALAVLEHTLIGLAASPLRKALIESGLGEDLTGVGLEAELRQMYFSVGLKGVDPAQVEKAMTLVRDTLADLARDGLPAPAVEAALNTLEFRLRENNTGSFPRGLSLMLRSLTAWLHDGDPLGPIRFEAPLAALKGKLEAGERVLETLLRVHFLENPHHVALTLLPDPERGQRLAAEEKARVDSRLGAMDQAGRTAMLHLAERIERFQHTPDSPEALAAIPKLRLADLPRQESPTPGDWPSEQVFFHDLPTAGVVYLDLGFDLSGVDGEALPLLPLFTRALFEMGTSREDFAAFLQRIARKTGGIGRDIHLGALAGGTPDQASARLVVRAKSTPDKVRDMADILREAFADANFDDKRRFRQMVLESKARKEQALTSSGHAYAARRLRARFHKAAMADERMHGVSSLAWLRALVADFDARWPWVLETLHALRDRVLTKDGVVANVTLDAHRFEAFAPVLGELMAGLPSGERAVSTWPGLDLPCAEGLSAPVQVNYVAKGAPIPLDTISAGAMLVACRHLRNAYLWERVRVRGGAYGAFCMFDRFAGSVVLVSYRDPNLLPTLDTFDAAGPYLETLDLCDDDLERAVIGAVGDLDAYQLPDAKGYTALARHFVGDTAQARQTLRQQVMDTSLADLRRCGQALTKALAGAPVVALGAAPSLDKAAERLSGLVVTKAL